MTATLPQPTAGFDEDLLNKLTTQHNALQQMWLSGYLYGIALHGHAAPSNGGQADPLPAAAIAPSAAVVLPKVTVLYGSQTGNSKKVAGQIAARVRERGWEISVADLNDYPTKNLKGEKIVLFVVSTQGEGDPPVSAEEFHKWLLGPRAPKLDGLQFAVCGLGDKSYLKFCQTGKEFDVRLEELGATRLAGRADCDVDFEETVEAWVEAVLLGMPEVRSGLPAPVNGQSHALASSREVMSPERTSGVLRHDVMSPERTSGVLLHDVVSPERTSGVLRHDVMSPERTSGVLRYDRKRPFAAPVLEKIKLNGRGSQKETWHLELSLEGSGLHYEPGDSLGVYPKNAGSMVREVLYTAMLNGNKILRFNGKDAPFREILLEVELSVLTREAVEKYAAWTNHSKLKTLLEDTAALKKFLWGRNVADLLREFPAAMSEATLLGFLRKMPPRLYSIASSPAAHAGEVHLTVAAVRYDFSGRPHQGVASTFLADRIATGAAVPVFIEHNEYFKLPADDSADIIMVGPGTGVAPFRAFVEERSERGSTGKNWLFFGNPHFETDFLYQTEWLNHLKRGTLDRLDVAFSRDQEQKLYVQHRLAERSKLIFERLENGAYFYVCGDKERMASDVQAAVLQIIEKESGRGGAFAAEYLKGLKKQRRYLEDVY